MPPHDLAPAPYADVADALSPAFPAGVRPVVGVVGCGEVVRLAHLPAYRDHGVRVAGIHDPRPGATDGVREEFGVERVHDGLDELLADPEIAVVDVATHPDVRPELIRRALAAGKHVLSQKPLALDLPTARALAAEAERHGRLLAVNQNGRWAPPWRAATLLVEAGEIGDVLSVTHVDDREFGFIVGLPYDRISQFVIADYSIHWIDITRCWIDAAPVAVQARDYRTPGQPAEGAEPWGAWMAFEYEDGRHALIRQVGCSSAAAPGELFWIHGTRGTIRGRVGDAGFAGDDELTVERDGAIADVPLAGRWFNDGFAGALAELACAIAEDREPYHSARHHLLSLQMTLAAQRSAAESGRRVRLDELG